METAKCKAPKAKISLPAWYIRKYKVRVVEQSNQKKVVEEVRIVIREAGIFQGTSRAVSE